MTTTTPGRPDQPARKRSQPGQPRDAATPPTPQRRSASLDAFWEAVDGRSA